MSPVQHESFASEIVDTSVTDVTQFLTSAAFAIAVLALGVPVWLATTNVYRAHVPYSAIEQLERLQLDDLLNRPLPVSLQLVTADDLQVSDLGCVGGVNRREAAEEEWQVLKSGGLAALDAWWMEKYSTGNSETGRTDRDGNHTTVLIGVYVLSFTDSKSDTVGAPTAQIVLGKSTVFMTPAAARRSLCDLLAEMIPLTKYTPVTLSLSNPTRSASAVLPVTASYDVVFTVAVGRPDLNDPVPPDVTDRVIARLRPLLESLRSLARFTVKSQYVYHVNLGVKVTRDPDTGQSFISRDQLPLVVTPLERRLGSVVSTASTLHFVVYVPATSERPLFVRGGQSLDTPASAFVAARWGGVFIANDLSAATNVTQISAVFAAQLRQLIGASVLADEPAIDRTLVSLTHLEMALLRRRRIAECLQRASANLAALASMLAQISNIVISDQVSATVCAGVDHFDAAVQLWRAGDERGAHERALAVLNASETAVYHPSMLALLYFPHDQKYAIYIPLFLPVCIPVFGSLRSMLGFIRKRRAAVAAKKDI